MKIFIAVPTYENIHPETFKSIYGIDKCGHWVVFDYVQGYGVAMARNLIGRQAIAEEADYVLMVDNDVRLPHDALRNLLEEPVDVCLGYCARRWDYGSNVYKLGEFSYTDVYSVDELRQLREQGVKREKIHGGGMACALIRTEVFKRIPYPYFAWTFYQNGEVLSEDLNFCQRLNELNIPIYVDPRVGCGHLFRQFKEVM